MYIQCYNVYDMVTICYNNDSSSKENVVGKIFVNAKKQHLVEFLSSQTFCLKSTGFHCPVQPCQKQKIWHCDILS